MENRPFKISRISEIHQRISRRNDEINVTLNDDIKLKKFLKKDVCQGILDYYSGCDNEISMLIPRFSSFYNGMVTSFSFRARFNVRGRGIAKRKIELKLMDLVGKVVPQDVIPGMREKMVNIYRSEIYVSKYYMKIINRYLMHSEVKIVEYPKFIYSDTTTKHEEILVVEDPIGKNFEKFDCSTIMSFNIASAVISTYARLHAGFFLAEKDGIKMELNESVSLEERNKFLCSEEGISLLDSVKKLLNSSVKAMENEENLKDMQHWIKLNKNSMLESILNDHTPTENFRTISHGSIGNNSLYLRRMNEEIQVCLNDFSNSMITSIAVDLNNLFFICLDSTSRKQNMEKLLLIYFNTYGEILQKNFFGMPFTFDELKVEVRKKFKTGWFAALNGLQSFIGGKMYHPRLDLLDFKNMNNFSDDVSTKFSKLLENNLIFKNRILDMYNDFSYCGVNNKLLWHLMIFNF